MVLTNKIKRKYQQLRIKLPSQNKVIYSKWLREKRITKRDFNRMVREDQELLKLIKRRLK